MKRRIALIPIIFACACADAPEVSEQVGHVRTYQAAPQPGQDERHLVLSLHVDHKEAPTVLELQVAAGPPPGANRGPGAFAVTLIDGAGGKLGERVMDHPLDQRMYSVTLPNLAPHQDQHLESADVWIALPFDHRLTSLVLYDRAQEREYRYEVVEMLARACEREVDPSLACARFLESH